MGQINGVVVGLVTNVSDPEQQGRIKVHFPWLASDHESDWIRIATTMSGNGRGTFFMPEVNDEALLAFEHGDVRFPYVIGFLWNGQDQPPAGDRQHRLIHSVNGHEIEMYDPAVSQGDKGFLRIKDAHGNTIEMVNGRISITGVSFIEIRAPPGCD